MKIKKLKELKHKLVNDKDLSDIWLFYMDHFVDDPKFTDLGKPAENQYLEAILQKSCEQMFGRVIKITNFLLIHIPQYRLFHGPLQVEAHIGGVIYFDDIQVGLFAMSEAFSPTGEVKYSRFYIAQDHPDSLRN
jgi:hypothetical protein